MITYARKHVWILLILLLITFMDGAAEPADPTQILIIDLALDQQDIRFYGISANDYTGHAVAFCDLNGDGWSDYAIGAPGFDYMGRSGCGIVYLLFSSDTLSATVDLSADRPDLKRILGPSANSQLGSVLMAGNIDGNAFGDLICGMPSATANGKFWCGRIAVAFGSASFPDTIDLASPPAGISLIDGENAFDKLGSSLAANDVNNDAFDDIIAGAPFATTPAGAASGKVFIIFGEASLPALIDLAAPSSPVTQILGDYSNAVFGTSCAAADINGDPFADIIIGAPQTSLPGRSAAGVVYLLSGRASFPDTINAALAPTGLKRILGCAADDLTGFAVATGNVTGTGIHDILFSAPDHSLLSRTGSGVVYAIEGGILMPDTIDLEALLIKVTEIHGPSPGDAIGLSLASADLNADGYDELIFGAPNASPNGRPGAGEVFLFFGRTVMPTFVDLIVFDSGVTIVAGADDGDYTGGSLGVGNANADPYDDLLIGARSSEGLGGILTGVANLITGDDHIVPVLLVSHQATATPEGVELFWELHEPVEVAEFVVERSHGSQHAAILPNDWIRETPPGFYYFSDPSVVPGTRYVYRVHAGDNFLFSTDVSVPSMSTRLLPNFPNPFRDETTIRFCLTGAGRAVICIYDVRGALVTVVANTLFEGGPHTVAWNGRDMSGRRVASGIYFMRMEFGGKQFYRKIVVLR